MSSRHLEILQTSSFDCSLLVTYFCDFCLICPNRDDPFHPWKSNSALHYAVGSIFQKKIEILEQKYNPSRLVPCAAQLASPEAPDEAIQENESTLCVKYGFKLFWLNPFIQRWNGINQCSVLRFPRFSPRSEIAADGGSFSDVSGSVGTLQREGKFCAFKVE